MNIKPLHFNFKMPEKSTAGAGAFDLFMPEPGQLFPYEDQAVFVGLGFAAEVPLNHVALLLPRSGVGAKKGLELNNTCGVIDSDYRGEWKVAMRVKNNESVIWQAGDRLFQMLVVPVASVSLTQVDELRYSARGEGGFGHTGS